MRVMGNSRNVSCDERFLHALVVDDCQTSQVALSEYLVGRAIGVLTCETLTQARAVLREQSPDLIILEFSHPDGTALDLVDELNAIRPQPLVIVTSGR